MFENQQDTVDALILESEKFRRLYDKHTTLKTQVLEAQNGHSAVDETDLEQMKKQKLNLKDQMADLIKTYTAMHA